MLQNFQLCSLNVAVISNYAFSTPYITLTDAVIAICLTSSYKNKLVLYKWKSFRLIFLFYVILQSFNLKLVNLYEPFCTLANVIAGKKNFSEIIFFIYKIQRDRKYCLCKLLFRKNKHNIV